MSDTATHARGTDSPLHPITGEPPGIKEILERRVAEGNPAPTEPASRETEPADDDAEIAAREVASLRHRVEAAEAGRAEADRLRVAAENDRAAAVRGAEDTGLTAINTALASAEREKDSLLTESKAAGEAGDFARQAEINFRLGSLGAEIRDLSQGKQQFEQERQTRIANPPRPAEPRIVAATPEERGILQNLGAPSREAFLASRTPQTRDFLYQHPEFFTDPAAFQRMTGAEALARGEGKALDSQAYFDRIKEVALGQTTQPPRREPADRRVPGAGPTRDAPGPTGRTRTGDVYVTQEQKAAAEWMGVDPADYARDEQELRHRGELPYRRR